MGWGVRYIWGITMLYIEKNDERVNEIIIALNSLIAEPPKTKRIGFTAE